MLLSVLIPTYNYVEGVKKILENTPDDFFNHCEVIIFDNSSNRSVQDYIESLDFPIIYKRKEPRGNPCENWNDLIKKASGKYINVMHHDEYIAEYSDWNQLIASLSTGSDLYLCKLKINKNGKLFSHVPEELRRLVINKFPNYLFRRNLVGPCACLIFKKDLRVSFDDRLMWYVDVEFYQKIFMAAGSKEFLDSVCIYSFYRGDGTITSQIDNKLKEIKVKESLLLSKDSDYLDVFWLKDSFFVKFVLVVESIFWGSFRVLQKLFR